MNLSNWRKTRQDSIFAEVEIWHGRMITIISGSRYDKRGYLQGYIVHLTDDCGYEITTFKHYIYRQVAVLSVLTEYKLKFSEDVT